MLSSLILLFVSNFAAAQVNCSGPGCGVSGAAGAALALGKMANPREQVSTVSPSPTQKKTEPTKPACKPGEDKPKTKGDTLDFNLSKCTNP